jgi:hypothetical protein
MAPPAYAEARLRARFHLQLEYQQPRIVSTPDYVTIRARVRRVFRDSGTLALGDEIQFDLPIRGPGDPIPLDGNGWILRGAIADGRYLEVFLNGNPPSCTLAASQYRLLPELSRDPLMDVPTEAEVAAQWAAFRRG